MSSIHERPRDSVGSMVPDEQAQLVEPPGSNGSIDDEWRLANSPAMRAVKSVIQSVTATDVTVLVWGESGVGKEIIPRLLHRKSPRRDQPFIKVNCAALPLELLESELFGYERGAFTGAHRQKAGKFALADKGTIFLDEIGELPWPLQAKLLHILQDREFSRLGSEETTRVDVRVVAATNQDLADLVRRRRFREDLYYRLNVVNIHVPALRYRREEIPFLVDHFIQRCSEQYQRRPRPISAATMRRFMAYPWPGNIRELENTVKRIVVLGSEAWVAEELGLGTAASSPPARVAVPPASSLLTDVPSYDGLSLKEIGQRAVATAERVALQRVLGDVHWNRREAARRLKVNYKTVLSKIDKYGIARSA